MNAATVNDPADNIVLEYSNASTYHLAGPAYTGGLSATYAITDGPLQPGSYILTISGLSDRFGRFPQVMEMTQLMRNAWEGARYGVADGMLPIADHPAAIFDLIGALALAHSAQNLRMRHRADAG